MPREGLSESLIDPALALLRRQGAEVRFGARLRGIEFADGRAVELLFEGSQFPLRRVRQPDSRGAGRVAARLVPGLTVPDEHAPIVNAHFR